jgi:hypothetical protein
MTEDEWLGSDDTQKLYWHARVRPPASRSSQLSIMNRRLGSLFATACIRATPQAAKRPFLLPLAKKVERIADSGSWDDLKSLDKDARERNEKEFRAFGENSPEHYWGLVGIRLTDSTIAEYAMHVPLFLLSALKGAKNVRALRKAYADVLRDIAGNPFRGGRGQQFNPRPRKKPQQEPVFRPEWRTDTVLALARGVYADRAFDRLPILADALQDAGCFSEPLLTHLRDTTVPHVRGCWALDLVLGKQ